MARRRMLAPIHTIKHFVARSNTGTTPGGLANLVIAEAKVAPAAALTSDVLEGSIIKAVHVEMWCAHNSAVGNSSQITFIVEKVPAGQAAANATQLLNLQAYPNKKNIFYTFQGITPNTQTSNPIPLIRDWLLIPKGKQRMGFGDKLVLSFTVVSETTQTCGMTIYKEYR